MIEKVIFCDCSDRALKKLAKKLRGVKKEVIYCGNGYKINHWLGQSLLIYKQRDYSILTNDTQFLDNQYCWSEEEKSCELYIVPNIENPSIIKASCFIDGEIKRANNLRNLFIKGVFNFEE